MLLTLKGLTKMKIQPGSAAFIVICSHTSAGVPEDLSSIFIFITIPICDIILLQFRWSLKAQRQQESRNPTVP